MNDSFKGLMVILEEDQVTGKERFISAIKLMKGVADVQPIRTNVFNDVLIKKRTVLTIKKEFDRIINDVSDGKSKLID